MKVDLLELLEKVLTVRKLADESKLPHLQHAKIINLTDAYLEELVRVE